MISLDHKMHIWSSFDQKDRFTRSGRKYWIRDEHKPNARQLTSSTPLGDTKMPLPMMDPTMTVTPLSSVIFGFSSTTSSPVPCNSPNKLVRDLERKMCSNFFLTTCVC
jgi:hypothetical protein